jgi:geranylgeranyl diphosphate synthase type II
MYSITELQNKISDKINNLKIIKNPKNLYEPINYILNLSGKRLRPTMVLAACNVFSENVGQAVNAALAYEIFHNFTLLHDDVMDNSPLRRGKPTVHKKWNINTAILSGDAMMIIAQNFILKSPPETLAEVSELFNQTALEVCEGQQYDMDFETENSVSEIQYTEMIRLKTSVLLAACLKTGAIIGGAKKNDAELIYNYGINLGLAFQLQDDYLDVYGDTEVFGKRKGGDIIADKKTFLLIKAFEKSTGETLKKLQQTVGNKNITDLQKVNTIIEIYDSLKIKDLCFTKIEEYYRKAILSLEKSEVEPERIKILEQFAKEIMLRNK